MYSETFDIPLGEDVNIKVRTRRVDKAVASPIGVEFAVMGFVRTRGNFEEVIRIDNSPHQGKFGVHIHFFDRGATELASRIRSPEEAILFVEGYLTTKYGMFL